MKIKIIHLNVRHWINTHKINMMSNYFLKEDPDIITLNAHSIIKSDKNVKLVNYSAFTKNKQIDRGITILIKKDIPHTFHTDTYNNNVLAVTKQTRQGKMRIITFYRPPRQKDLPLMVDINKSHTTKHTYTNFGRRQYRTHKLRTQFFRLKRETPQQIH